MRRNPVTPLAFLVFALLLAACGAPAGDGARTDAADLSGAPAAATETAPLAAEVTLTPDPTSAPAGTATPVPPYVLGDVLYEEDFEGPDSDYLNWSFSGPDGAMGPDGWTIETEADGNHHLLVAPNLRSLGNVRADFGRPEWRDYSFSLRLALVDYIPRKRDSELTFRGAPPSCPMYIFRFGEFRGLYEQFSREGPCDRRVVNNTDSLPHPLVDRWYAMQIIVFGEDVHIFVDGAEGLTYTGPMPEGGQVGISTKGDIWIDDIKIQEVLPR